MSKRVRFLYHYLSAVLKKQWRRLSFSALLVVFLLASLSFFTPAFSKSFTAFTTKTVKPVFREGIVGKPQTFNPLFSRLEAEKEINSLVFRGLTKISPSGAVEMDLAESVEVKNNTEYVFKLKKDVRWSDGKNFSADDVIHTIATAQNQLYDAVVAENFRDIQVKKIDNDTVSFKLKEPFAPFLSTTSLGVIPKHISLTDYRPIGTGNFKFIQQGKDSVMLESSTLRVRFQFYPNEEAAILALKLGEIHALSVGRNKLAQLRDWSNFKVETPALPYRLSTLFYNTKEAPLNEKNIRQALTYAIDKNEVVKNSNGVKGKVATNSYALLEALQVGTKEKYTFNIEKANQLLSSEGWQLTQGKRMKEGKQLSLTVTTLADDEFEDSAKKIKTSWEKLGIEVTVAAVSGSELKDQIVPNRTYSVLLSSLLLNSDPDQYVIWHTTQVSEGNISGISSPKLDKLLEDARRTLDLKIRSEKYQEFSKHLLDESPAVFLYYPNYNWVYSNRLQGLDLSSFREPVDRFKSTSKWFLRRPLI